MLARHKSPSPSEAQRPGPASGSRAGRLFQLLAGLAALALSTASLAPAPACAGEIAVIVNASNRVDDLSLTGLQFLYAGRRRSWPDGTPVTLLLPPPGSAAMSYVVKTLFRKASEDAIAQYYVTAIYQSELSEVPPQPSLAEALRIVRADRGALVVVDVDDVSDTTGLRILSPQ